MEFSNTLKGSSALQASRTDCIQTAIRRTWSPKPFAAAASAGKSEPYHGYYFLMLKSQGPDATGGTLDYVVKGKDDWWFRVGSMACGVWRIRGFRLS